MPEPRVTICILHFLRHGLLEQCLQTLKRNVKIPYKVVVINDGPDPLIYPDRKIRIVNFTKKMKIGEKKRICMEFVDTEYWCKLDNDIMVQPGALEAQVRMLDIEPDLGVVSGITFRHGQSPHYFGAANFKILGQYLIKIRQPLCKILKWGQEGRLLYFDHVPEGHTTFRTEIFDDVSFDPNITLGYSHWDIFLQLYFTDWKAVIHPQSFFDHRHDESGERYQSFRSKEWYKLIREGREYFIKKWGLIPVDWFVPTTTGKFFHLLNTYIEKIRCPRVYAHTLSKKDILLH